jgi:protein-tyrosine phosphatase
MSCQPEETPESVLFALLTPEEAKKLELNSESREVKKAGMRFILCRFPIARHRARKSEITATLEKFDQNLFSGESVVIHCRQGIGGAGLVAGCLLMMKGLSSGARVWRV